eukprot:s4781_g4.t1
MLVYQRVFQDDYNSVDFISVISVDVGDSKPEVETKPLPQSRIPLRAENGTTQAVPAATGTLPSELVAGAMTDFTGKAQSGFADSISEV